MPKFIDNKLKNVLKIKDKLFDTIKTVDNSIKSIKNIKQLFGGGTTLINNKMKNILKIIKSLENRGILLKRITRKIASQQGEF